jgi:putative exosortase-associated protein (TIGR04073 family)
MPKPLKIYLLAGFLAAAAPMAGAADGYAAPGAMNSGAYKTAAPKKPPAYGEAIATKLGAGFANVVLGPAELPKNVINTTNEGNLALGLTAGVLKGVLHMLGRAMAGVVDVMTFPLPTEPLTTPQYVWDDFKVETRYNPLFKMKNVQ